jgi:hypothetical protein
MTLTRIGLPGPFAGSAHRMSFEQSSSNCITARCSCGWSVTYDKDEPHLPCEHEDEIHSNGSRRTSMLAGIVRQISSLTR